MPGMLSHVKAPEQQVKSECLKVLLNMNKTVTSESITRDVIVVE